MNRILFKADEIDADGMAHLDGVRATHVVEVLHGVPGQRLKIGVVDGPTGDGVITLVAGGRVQVKCELDLSPPPAPMVDLILALPRPKVMKRLWAPLASMGLGRIVIVNAEKVERNYFDTQWLESAHYERLLLEGLMQSGDTRLPQVSIRRRFKVFVEDQLDGMFPDSFRCVCDPAGAPAVPALRDRTCERVLLAVGPEGGWTDFEVELLKTRGFTGISMGRRILRSDTACIAALAVAQAVERKVTAIFP